MELRYDPVAEQWSYVNVPQNFIDTNSFTSNDPQFKYGNTSDQDNQDDQEDADPCPPGFRQVTLNDGTKVCMQIEEPIQQDRGGISVFLRLCISKATALKSTMLLTGS